MSVDYDDKKFSTTVHSDIPEARGPVGMPSSAATSHIQLLEASEPNQKDSLKAKHHDSPLKELTSKGRLRLLHLASLKVKAAPRPGSPGQ